MYPARIIDLSFQNNTNYDIEYIGAQQFSGELKHNSLCNPLPSGSVKEV